MPLSHQLQRSVPPVKTTNNRTLVPTYERRLTPIKDVLLPNIRAGNVKFLSRVLGQKELPVEHITLRQVKATTLQGERHIHEHVAKFKEE